MKYRVYFFVCSQEDGWGKKIDGESIRVFRLDENKKIEPCASERGLSMEDVGEAEWDILMRRFDRFTREVDAHAWDMGEDYTDIWTD